MYDHVFTGKPPGKFLGRDTYQVSNSNTVGIWGLNDVLWNYDRWPEGIYIEDAPVITAGQVVFLDAANYRSYSGSGNTWYDLSGNNTNGTNTESTIFPTFSENSFEFNGTTNRIIIPRTVSDDFTLACWFKTTSSAGVNGNWWQGGPLVDAEIAGVTTDFGISIGAGKLMMGIGASDTTIRSTNSYNDGNWHYVTGTRIKSTGEFKLYVDGQLVATGTGNNSSLVGNSIFSIGLGANAATFSGRVGLVQIYNRALTLAEIQQNFEVLRSRYGL